VEAYGLPTIVDLDVEAASDGEKHHLAGAMSMVSPGVAALDVVGPEDASDGEGHMAFGLTEGQAAAIVSDAGKLHQEASAGKLWSWIIHLFALFSAQSYKKIPKCLLSSQKNSTFATATREKGRQRLLCLLPKTGRKFG